MKFNQIFDVFSRRNKKIEPYIKNAPITFRTKVLLYCQDLFSNNKSSWGRGNYAGEFWNEIHQVFLYRHGKFRLSDGNPQTRKEDVLSYLSTCKDDEFFDFIEYIFKVKCLFHIPIEENIIVTEINELFISENIGFELTEISKEEVIEQVNAYPFFGKKQRVINIIAYPQVIKKEDQVIHNTTILPTLNLLNEPEYKIANQEYLDALEDYRKGDYGDCLTKCNSAFESVMKIICNNRNWQYSQKDPASILLTKIVNKTGVETFFEAPLIIIATLRNKLSKSHGAGIIPKKVSKNYAQFALNSTATAILFLVNETK